MKTYVLGDIHGSALALKQCFDRSQFDFTKDHLIFLGDVCDRGPETVECVDLLLQIKNLIAVIGNHDLWTTDWLRGHRFDEGLWRKHGGNETARSYTEKSNFEEIRAQHLKEYYSKLIPYYKDDQNRIFVHAGFDWRFPIEESSEKDLYWDRTLFNDAIYYHPEAISFPRSNPYHEIYIGHSPTHNIEIDGDRLKPMKFCNVWMMDQGAGWGKYLSMMNVDNKEVFQSDLVSELYK